MKERIRTNLNIRKRVAPLSKGHPGCIKISVANSKEHEIKKALMAIDLIFEGKDIYIECHHEDTSRISDIYVANYDRVIEIAVSETDKSLKEKREEFEGLDYKFTEVRK